MALWQPALRAMGWHVEFHLPIDRRPEWTDVIESFDIPVVIDHMGRPTPRCGRSLVATARAVDPLRGAGALFREAVSAVSPVT